MVTPPRRASADFCVQSQCWEKFCSICLFHELSLSAIMPCTGGLQCMALGALNSMHCLLSTSLHHPSTIAWPYALHVFVLSLLRPSGMSFSYKIPPFRDRSRTDPGPIRDRSRTVPDPFRDRSGTDLGPFRDRSGTDLGPIWDRSGTDPGPIWDRSGTVPGPIRDRSGTVPGPFRDRSRTRVRDTLGWHDELQHVSGVTT